jgi:hypothetical protein
MASTLPLTPPLECDATLGLTIPGTELKAGDAVGQPRKFCLGRPAPEPEAKADELAEEGVGAISSTTPDSPGRGVKRGSGRIPVQPLPPADLPPHAAEATRPRAYRSHSTTSISSQQSELDQRATKRRSGEPSLSNLGLSSPPPSREHTPQDDLAANLSQAQHPEPPTPPANEIPLPAPLTPEEETFRSHRSRPRVAGNTFKDKQAVPRSPRRNSSSNESSASDSELSSSASSAVSSLPLGTSPGRLRARWNPLARYSNGRPCKCTVEVQIESRLIIIGTNPNDALKMSIPL